MTRRQLAELVRGLAVAGPVSRALTQAPSSTPIGGPDDNTYFDLFRRVTVPGTCALFPSSFWQENIMQMAHIEPAIWHAVIALGALHRKVEVLALPKGPDNKSLDRQALAHYGKAMALARDLDSPAKVVSLSIALVAAANMLERWSDMQTHVMAGLRIAIHDGQVESRLGMLGGSLMRIDMQAMTFSDSMSPYPYEKSSSIYDADQFLASANVRGDSYEELSSELFGMARTFLLLDDSLFSGNATYTSWLDNLHTFLRRLNHWESSISSYEGAQELSQSSFMTRLSLRMYHATLRMMIRASWVGPESRYDALLGYFEYLVRLAATLRGMMGPVNSTSFSLEPGIMIPLCLVGHRCRHYGLRRAALKILVEANRIEGMWRSDATAAIIGALIAVEEENLGPVTAEIYTPILLGADELDIPWSAWSTPTFQPPTTIGWSSVPVIAEEHRVKELLGTARLSERCIDVCLMMCPPNDTEPFGEAREVTVRF